MRAACRISCALLDIAAAADVVFYLYAAKIDPRAALVAIAVGVAALAASFRLARFAYDPEI